MADIHVALKDSNSVASAIFESSTSAGVILRGQIDQITGRVLVDMARGGFTVLAPTETPNGVITVFTFSTATAQPTFVVSDNAMMQATTKSGTVNWTWNAGAKQATMTIPPQDDIVAIQ